MERPIQVDLHLFFSLHFIFIEFLSSIADDGIARGNDALTLLENRQTYTLFIHELHRVSLES